MSKMRTQMEEIKSNISFNIFTYTDNIVGVRKSLFDKNGVYVYSYNGIVIYVGASQRLWHRPFRIYRKNGCKGDSIIFKKITSIFGYENMTVDIFFCSENQLAKKEIEFIKNLRPLTQLFTATREYVYRK